LRTPSPVSSLPMSLSMYCSSTIHRDSLPHGATILVVPRYTEVLYIQYTTYCSYVYSGRLSFAFYGLLYCTVLYSTVLHFTCIQYVVLLIIKNIILYCTVRLTVLSNSPTNGRRDKTKCPLWTSLIGTKVSARFRKCTPQLTSIQYTVYITAWSMAGASSH
jgi:hypothetical protein